MKPVSPVIPQSDETESIFAKDSLVYQPLPSIKRADGVTLTRWLLTEDERKIVAEQGYLYVSLITKDNDAIQPIKLTVGIPEEFEDYQALDEEWPTEING